MGNFVTGMRQALETASMFGERGSAMHRASPDRGVDMTAVNTIGVLVRAMLVVLLITTPTALLPDTTSDNALMVGFIALFGALFTIVEYSSKAPSLVEFRDAPPFNRLRFLTLMATVTLLTLLSLDSVQSTGLTRAIATTGGHIADATDFPHSPVRLMVLMMPADTPVAVLHRVRAAAGISYVVSLASLALFVLVLRLRAWPGSGRTFNVWVNLPTFNPTTGGDVVHRLRRDGSANLILGFLLPFLIPAVVTLAGGLISPVSLANSHTMIWMMSAWAFLPASLMMRGVAMTRVAQLIEDQRAAVPHDAALSPA